MKIRQTQIFKNISKNKFILECFYRLRVGEIWFYFSAWYWHLIHPCPEHISIKEIYKLFYLDFLKIPEQDCKIIEMTDKKLVTRCKNKCPILDFSLALCKDTRISCKQLSEGPCKYFLRKLNKNIVFKRNYDHIRPYMEDCEETILLTSEQN